MTRPNRTLSHEACTKPDRERRGLCGDDGVDHRTRVWGLPDGDQLACMGINLQDRRMRENWRLARDPIEDFPTRGVAQAGGAYVVTLAVEVEAAHPTRPVRVNQLLELHDPALLVGPRRPV